MSSDPQSVLIASKICIWVLNMQRSQEHKHTHAQTH